MKTSEKKMWTSKSLIYSLGTLSNCLNVHLRANYYQNNSKGPCDDEGGNRKISTFMVKQVSLDITLKAMQLYALKLHMRTKIYCQDKLNCLAIITIVL